jgi:hypothetical protein
MTHTTSTFAPPALTADVLAFATEQGVRPFLHPVLEMTSQIFQGRPLTVFVDEDPEIANDRHLVIDVDVVGFDAEQMLACQQDWINQIFHTCPATHVCVFRLGLTDSPMAHE